MSYGRMPVIWGLGVIWGPLSTLATAAGPGCWHEHSPLQALCENLNP